MVNADQQQEFATSATSALPQKTSRLSSLYDEKDEESPEILLDRNNAVSISGSFGTNSYLFQNNENPPWTVKAFDQERDIDIAPCLVTVCGCAPCCCCLYNGIDDLSDYSGNEESATDSKRRYNSFPVNKNVFLMMMLVFVNEVSESMWTGAIFSIYLFMQDYGNNALIGFLEAIYSISCLLFSFPLLHFSKKWNLIKAARLGGVAFILYIAIMIVLVQCVSDPVINPPKFNTTFITTESLFSSTDRNLRTDNRYFSMKFEDLSGQMNHERRTRTAELVSYFSPAMVVWGFATAVISGPVKNILSHSIPSDTRNQNFVFITLLQMMSKIFGPAISILVFASTENQWKLSSLKVVILSGVCLGFIVAILCFLFNEKWFIADDLDASSQNAGELEVEKTKLYTHQPTGISTSETVEGNEIMPSSTIRRDEVVVKNQPLFSFSRLVPFLFLLSNILITIGAGMTLPFFPVFFKNDINMSPLAVLAIYMAQPLFILIMFLIVSKFEVSCGNISTLLCVRSFGVLLLFLLSRSKVWLDNKAGYIGIIFLLRSALVNSTSFLENALFDEIVPAVDASVWKQLDNLIPLAWLCSAIGGGIYIDKESYTGSFLVSAIIQSVGVVFLIGTSFLKTRNELSSTNSKQ